MIDRKSRAMYCYSIAIQVCLQVSGHIIKPMKLNRIDVVSWGPTEFFVALSFCVAMQHTHIKQISFWVPEFCDTRYEMHKTQD